VTTDLFYLTVRKLPVKTKLNIRNGLSYGTDGLKVSGFQMTQKDMEFLTGRNFNRDSILAMFRVPPSMLGMSESTSYAAAKAVHYAFMKNVITPKMRRIVNVLNEFLLPLYGDSQLYFDFESPAKEDRDLIIKEYQTGLGSGWLSINDVRRAEELPEIEGGEVVNIPFGLQPLGEPVVDKSVSRDVNVARVADPAPLKYGNLSAAETKAANMSSSVSCACISVPMTMFKISKPFLSKFPPSFGAVSLCTTVIGLLTLMIKYIPELITFLPLH